MRTTEAEVREVLEPYHDSLSRVIDTAFQRWGLFKTTMLQRQSASLRAQVMHGFMMDEARKEFGPVPGIRLREDPQRALFDFFGEVLVRFKKLTDDFQTVNFPTTQSTLFDMQLYLPSVGPKAMVTAGYIPRDLWTGVDVYVVMHEGEELLWKYPLDLPTESRILPFAPQGVSGTGDLPLPFVPKADNSAEHHQKQ